MSDIKNWSQTDASNTDASKSGMPEGMPRSDVNDRVREHMGAMRRFYEDAEWVSLTDEHNADFTLSRVNDTTFRLARTGTDASSKFPVGTWVKLTIGGANRFGSVLTVTHSNPNTDVVLTEIVNDAYSSAGDDGKLLAGSVTLAATYISKRVRSAAFSKTGTTTGQSPQQIPTIDGLQGHVLRPEGHTADDTGINADRLDDQHASYFTERDLDFHANVASNSTFGSWTRGTTIDAGTDFTNADGNSCADDWTIVYDGADAFDYARVTAGNADGLKQFIYALKMTANLTNKKGGIAQTVSDMDSRQLVQNGKGTLSFWARTTAGDSISRANCAIYYSTAASPPADVVGSWGAEGVAPTPSGGWTQAGISASVFTITSTWTQFSITDVTIPATAINLASFIWIDQVTTTYNNTDEFRIAGVQLEPGPDVSPFQHSGSGLSDIYHSGMVSGLDAYIEIVSPSVLANYDGVATAHGFGRPPRIVTAEARCKVAQFGYSVDDILYLSFSQGDNHRGLTISADATNINWSIGNGSIQIIERDTVSTNAEQFLASDTNWELRIKAWK